MFGMFSQKKSIFIDKNLSEIKDITRILFIDDQDMDIIKSIQSQGWKIKHLYDLNDLNNPDFIDSHIVCVDIKGVGKNLQFKGEGLDLAKTIKERHPSKKIILYSSQSTHDIFNNALDIVDRRVFKDGQTYPFILAIEELAKERFNWTDYIKNIYTNYRKDFGKEIDFNTFKTKMESFYQYNPEEIDKQKIANFANISLSVAGNIASLLGLFK